MKARYFDPMFYICSDEMPFTIRIQVRLKDTVDEAALSFAMRTSIVRYPYFSVQLSEEDGELLTVPNTRPPVVYPGPQVLPLGSDAVNRHLVSASYDGCEINFHTSHVLTDGAGFFPFVKTVLYYYLCRRYGVELDRGDIRLCGDAFFDDELQNPYPEREMESAVPLYRAKKGGFFRLRDGGHVTDTKRTVYRFRVRQSDIMDFNYDHDGSPCSLVSSLMAKAVWSVHPDVKQDLVSAVSFNLRPGLGNRYSYRMLCSSLSIRYPEALRERGIAMLCTCTRGMVTLQSQPENVLAYARDMRRRLSALDSLPDVASKRRLLAPIALADSVDNTFSVSYVGNVGLGALGPYLDSIYNYTDGSTWQTVFIEISSVNDWFDIAFLQGFSSDVYYRAFLRQLDICGLSYTEDGSCPFNTPGICLPLFNEINPSRDL